MGRTMKTKRETPKCIRCGSADTEVEVGRWRDSDFRWQPEMYVCNDCDCRFTEDMVPELKPEWENWLKGG